MWTADKEFLKAVLRWFANPVLRWRDKSRHVKRSSLRVPTDTFPTFSLKADLCCGFIMILYSCIFVCGWNFHAPTVIELLLWRVASLTMLAFTVPGGFVLLYIEYRFFDDWMRRDATGFINRVVQNIARFLRLPLNPNRSMTFEWGKPVRRDTSSGIERLPRWATLYCIGMSAIYCIARTIILAEDFASLRKLPTSTFDTVQWSQYLPQV